MANETEIIDLLSNTSAVYSNNMITGNNMLYLTFFVIGSLLLFAMFIVYMIVRSKEKQREYRMIKQSVEIDKQIKKPKEVSVIEKNDFGVIENKSFRSWKKIKSWIDLKTRPQKCFLIEMTHFSGDVAHYITPESTKKFKIGINTYVIDTTCIQHNITSKLPMLRFHEGFALPFKVIVDIEQMHDKASNEAPKTQMSYYPDVLTGVIKSEYVKGVIAGGEVAPMLKKIFIVSLISCIGMAGCLIILLTGSDLLKDVL